MFGVDPEILDTRRRDELEVRQPVEKRCRELCMFSHSGDDIIRSGTLHESICIVMGIGEDVNRRNFFPNRRSFSKLGSRQE
jgi:hypothetical protein